MLPGTAELGRLPLQLRQTCNLKRKRKRKKPTASLREKKVSSFDNSCCFLGADMEPFGSGPTARPQPQAARPSWRGPGSWPLCIEHSALAWHLSASEKTQKKRGCCATTAMRSSSGAVGEVMMSKGTQLDAAGSLKLGFELASALVLVLGASRAWNGKSGEGVAADPGFNFSGAVH